MIRLYPNRPFIFDGAFGTCYSGLYHGDTPCELANVRHPERVIELHRQYVAAGADGIKTDSFTLNRVNFPDEALLEELVAGAIRCANAAAVGKAAVFADIGPIPDGTAADYADLVDIFIRRGAENFLFETFAEFAPLRDALTRVREKLPEAGVIVSFGAAPDGFTRHGNALTALVAEAAAHPAVDAVGFNCVCGPAHAARLAAELRVSKPLCVMPNAGYPVDVGGRTVYNDNADYFAERIKEICANGAKLVGGCCGTTPAHIAACVSALKSAPAPNAPASPSAEAGTAREEGAFALKLRGGERVVAVELDPPADSGLSAVADAAALLKNAGADVITFADNPLSRARADSFMTAACVHERTGAEVMPHLTCRDRNHLAIKSSLLAANAMGVRNVLAVTGDPLSNDEMKSKGVFALNSYNLIGYLAGLNSAEFASAPFCIGGALNIGAANFDAELARAKEKAARGAEYFLTQPVGSERALENLKKAHAELDAPVLAGVYPVAGYKNALFLKNEVSGIDVPDSLIAELKDKSREEAAGISVRYAASVAEKAAPYCRGFYIMTPMKRVDIVAALLEKLKEKQLI